MSVQMMLSYSNGIPLFHLSTTNIFLEHLLLRASLRVGSWGPIKKQRGVISAIKEMRADSGVTYLVWRFREGVLEEVDSQKGSTG